MFFTFFLTFYDILIIGSGYMVDVMIVLLLLISFIKGFKRGVIQEIVLIVGTILIYFIAFKFKDSLGILLCKLLPFLEFKGLYALNVLFYQLIAFVIIMTILYVIFRIVLRITGVFQKIINMSIIFTIPSKILGGVIGLIEGYIIIFTLLVVMTTSFSNSALITDSKLSKSIVNNTPILSTKTHYLTDITDDIYDLKNKNIKSVSDLNKKVLNIFKKHNIIKSKDVDSIIKKGGVLSSSEIEEIS